MSTDITERIAGKVAQTKKQKFKKIQFCYYLTRRALTNIPLGLSVAAASTAAQAQPQLTVVAQGLNSPRGLDFAPNGALYVAEAGLGAGDGNGGFAAGIGFTGSITEIRGVNSPHPVSRRIVADLVSVGDTENGFPEALGPSGLSAHEKGGIYVTIDESALGEAAAQPDLTEAARNQFGHLLKVTPRGHWKTVSDIGDFDYLWTGANQNQPWAPSGQFPDANPYGVLAIAGRQFVADAGANTVDEILPDGSVRIIAFVPNPELPLPNGSRVRVLILFTPGGLEEAFSRMSSPAQDLEPSNEALTYSLSDLEHTAKRLGEYGAQILAPDNVAEQLPLYPKPVSSIEKD